MANDSVEWTSEQMIENANNWSLCGDVAVFNRLKQFSQTVISGAEALNTNVDKLLNSLEEINLKLELTKNEFHSLRNTQFIENRVYEDDETLDTHENKAEAKEPTDEEKEIALKKSIAKGLEIMEKYFDKVELAISDSEGESNEKSYVMRPKDPYADRPLPYVVGTQEWYKKWHVGLLLSESEAESEPEEEVYSSSDSESNDLPKNRIPGSETSSELGFTNTDLDPDAHSTFNGSRDSNRLHYSSDEGSEQSGSVHSKAPISKQSFAEQLAAKLGDVVSNQTKEKPIQSNMRTKPSTKSVPRGKYGNLFSDEPPPLDELDDAMLPKTARQGLFTGSRDLFAENKNDPSWGSPQENNTIERSKSENPPSSTTSTVSKSKVPKGLFDNSDSSSEEDLLAITDKRKFMKVPPVNPYMQPSKPTVPFVDDEPPELITKDEVRSSKKKPVGGKPIFGENANIFAGKPTLSEKSQTAKPDIIEPPKDVKKASLFEDSSDEEMFVPKPKALTSADPANISNTNKKPLGLFEDISPQNRQLAKSNLSGKKLSLFDDDDDDDDLLPSNVDKALDKPAKNSESFVKPIYESSKTTAAEPKDKIKPKKISLFDDDDDLLKEEEDIFSGISKKTNLFEDLRGTSSKGLFSDAKESSYPVDLRAEKQFKDAPKSLFGDAGNVAEGLKRSLDKKTAGSLFDDADNSDEDFFSPKPKAEVDDIKNVRSEANITNLDVGNDQETAEEPIEYLSSNPPSTTADRQKDEVEPDSKEVDFEAKNLEIDTKEKHEAADLFEGKSQSTSLLAEGVLIGERDKKLEIDQESVLGELESTNPAQVQQKISLNDNESKMEDTSVFNESQPNFVTPPPINLFDPTPPPVDWDASSDNSGESDTFSLSDGILERANYNQSQSTSSVFDEAPPILPIFEISDVNHSSGIVKDMSASMVDTRTFNLFSPSASSTRRRSSDIFQEQQSQDNLFLTKSRNISLQEPHLSSITEQLEHTSKIYEITPSGTIGDFEDSSSVFEEIDVESSVNMSHSQVEVSKKKSLFSGDPDQKADEDKSNKADLKPSPGKLKHNLNINVGALLPGAAPTKNRIAKATSFDETVQTTPPKAILRPKPPVSLARPKSEIILTKHTPASLEDNFEDLGGTEVLHSITKDRAKIPIKRRPSTRRARQEAARKSMTDFNLYTEDASLSDESPNLKSSNNGSSGDLSNKLEQIDNDKTPDLTSVDTKGISLVFDNSEKSDISMRKDSISKLKQITDIEKNYLISKSKQPGKSDDEKVNTSSREKGNKEPMDILQKSFEDCQNVKQLNEDKLEVVSENPQPNVVKKESKNIFEDSFEDDLFKSNPKIKNLLTDDGLFKSADSFKSQSLQQLESTASNSNIFGEDLLLSRDEDLFTGTSKSLKKADGVLPVTKIQNSSSFLDGSGSDSDGDLFGGKATKAFIATKAKETQPSKKKSIFNDSEGSSEEDLFGAKQTRKSGLSSSADIKGVEGNTKRSEIKTANIKKLESQQVTDFDPLSGFK